MVNAPLAVGRPMSKVQNAKTKRRWLRYSLRTLLVLVTIACVGFGWLGMKVRAKQREREVIETIEKLGYYVKYDYEFDSAGVPIESPTLPGQAWLRPLVGDYFFASVVEVHCVSETTDSDLRDLLANLTRLRGLNVAWSKVTDAGLIHLAELTKLEGVELRGTEVTDNGLVHLRGLTKLKWLNLEGTKVAGTGFVHLKALTKLEWLNLERTKITDAGLAQFAGLTTLVWVHLAETKVTDEGVKQLQKGLPNLKITR